MIFKINIWFVKTEVPNMFLAARHSIDINQRLEV